MATRSNIAILRTGDFAGKVDMVYCHFDGYPEHNGKILLEHYSNLEKLEKLLSLGDLSSLAPEIGEKHDFNSSQENECTFFGRDRGEKDVGPRFYDSLSDAREDMEEYLYLFDEENNKWTFCKRGYNFKDLTLAECE